MEFFAANPRQFLRDIRDLVIGSGDQDHTRREDLPSQSRRGLPCSNEPNGAARTRIAAGNDGANLPPQFGQAASQRTSYASRPDDGKAILHHVLG